MRQPRFWAGIGGILFAAGVAVAAEPPPLPVVPESTVETPAPTPQNARRWFLNNLSVAPIFVAQSGGGWAFGSELGWQPRYALGKKYSLHGLVGFAAFTQRNQTAMVLSLKTVVSIAARLGKHAEASLGLGPETWFSYGGLAFTYLGQLSWLSHEPKWGFPLERVTVGYALCTAVNTTHQVRVAFGFQF